MKPSPPLPIHTATTTTHHQAIRLQFSTILLAFFLGGFSTFLLFTTFQLGNYYGYSEYSDSLEIVSIPVVFNDINIVLNVDGDLKDKIKEEEEKKKNEDTEFPYRPPVEWDITKGHDRRLEYTVNEGTWMSVDLSPDGTTIVFDLLGDLYTLPIAGGKAQPIKTGVAFDRYPRFSPDGNRVLFATDIDGCDNVFILDLNTMQTQPVTAEPYRFVSNAAWLSNDTVLGVKWFTSGRSIPAGEIWSFQVSSNPDSGVQLVGRPSFDNQIGPEEPIPSPDGKYFYYSKNTMDPSVFEYSKDPNKGIYTIYRYEIATKASTSVTGGSGGAARPVISRSGKYLAFVRRSIFKNSLVIKDLELGNERIISDNLSFDQQASSAPSGVYPSFSWTPDDSHIIIWAQGKLWKINVETGASTEIPFTVDIGLDLSETVRPETDPSTGETFEIKVVQGAHFTPSSSSIIFTTQGRSYLKSLPSGAPKLILSGRDTTKEFEFGVSPSPNGIQAVHAVWNDVDMGYIEIFTLDNSASPIRVTTSIGRYGSPSFSLDGKSLVFTRHSSDTLSGPFYAKDSGIYTVSLQIEKDGKIVGIKAEPKYITSGSKAIFSSTNNGSLIVERYNQVAQVFLDGKPEQTLVQSKYTYSISVSPDLKYVAFIDFSELYLAPLTLGPNGEALQISTKPGETTAGLRRLSKSGGAYFSWPVQGDSSKISWLLGATFYTVSTSSVNNCSADESNKYGLDCIIALTSSIDLSFEVETNIPGTLVAFDNAVILTMDGDESTIIQNGRLIVKGDRILEVGKKEEVEIPDGAEVVDVQGGVIMPGFVDVHAHWSSASDFWVHQSWEFLVNLAFGVTTVHNPSYDTIYGFTDAELVRSGKKIGPRIFLTGTILYGAIGYYRCEIYDLESARENLLRLKAYGAFSVKSYQQPCRSSRQMVLDAARELGMAVVPEGGMNFFWNVNQIIDGHTTIEHSLPVAPLYKDVVTLFSQSGTAYTPTLVVSYGGIYGENYWYQETNLWENERVMKFSPHSDIQSRSMQRMKAHDNDYHHFTVSKSVKDVSDNGGLVELGAHGQRQGIGFHWEIWLFSQGGMSNYNVLKAATSNGAESLGLKDLGKLKAGYLADIIVYTADNSPLENIRNSEKLKFVMKDGRMYDAATMDQVLPEYVPLPPGPELNIPSSSSK